MGCRRAAQASVLQIVHGLSQDCAYCAWHHDLKVPSSARGCRAMQTVHVSDVTHNTVLSQGCALQIVQQRKGKPHGCARRHAVRRVPCSDAGCHASNSASSAAMLPRGCARRHAATSANSTTLLHCCSKVPCAQREASWCARPHAAHSARRHGAMQTANCTQ